MKVAKYSLDMGVIKKLLNKFGICKGGVDGVKTELLCCPSCFVNSFIQQYIDDKYEDEGCCPYCKAENAHLISVKTLGAYLRECIDKAYEHCDAGTGVMWDSETKDYLGPNPGEANIYSIREIMTDIEPIISYESEGTTLLDDLFENLYSYREIQKGADDPFADIDSPVWVVKGDLWGSEQTYVSRNWEAFKHIIKHYSRFFDFGGFNLREIFLECMDPYMNGFIKDISSETRFFRARRKTDQWPSSIDDIEPYSEMGAPPANYAKTNRMSPAGIPYLYLASDIETTIAECRIKTGEEAIIAEFVSKEDLQILDLSVNRGFPAGSIFDPEYDHDNTWMNDFWDNYVKEISQPISDDFEDHSYEYAATQLIAEYYRTKGYDGICFRSSVGPGKNYVFFMGPDPKHTVNAYPYPYSSAENYWTEDLPILREFTEAFQIESIKRVEAMSVAKVIECRTIST